MDNFNINSDFALICGYLESDETCPDGTVILPIEDTYTLICNGYTLTRNNRIEQTDLVNKGVLTDIYTRSVNIEVKGEVDISDNPNFYTAFDNLSKKTEPFTICLGTYNFENMLVKSFVCNIDTVKNIAVCDIVFMGV